MQARVSRELHDRIAELPKAVQDIARQGQMRMCQRERHPVAPGKAAAAVTTAIACEMVAGIRAIARSATPPPFCQVHPSLVGRSVRFEPLGFFVMDQLITTFE